MDDIIKKLHAGGVSHDIIEQLKTGLWNTFETELITNGFKVAAEKIGIDTTHLPHIDFHNIGEAGKELIGTDVDDDGRTGVAEALENLDEACKHSDITQIKDSVSKTSEWFFAKIWSFFWMK